MSLTFEPTPIHELEEKIIRKLIPVCREIARIGGGEYDIAGTSLLFGFILCATELRNRDTPSPEQIELFYKFTRENKKPLEELYKKEKRTLWLHILRKIGKDLEAIVTIEYKPLGDTYEVSVGIVSSHGSIVRDVIRREEKVGELTYRITGVVERDREGREFGAGYVKVIVSASLETLKEAVNKAVELARATAEEVSKKLLRSG